MNPSASKAGYSWLHELESIALESIDREGEPEIQNRGRELLAYVKDVWKASEAEDLFAAVWYMSCADQAFYELALLDGLPEDMLDEGYTIFCLKDFVRAGRGPRLGLQKARERSTTTPTSESANQLSERYAADIEEIQSANPHKSYNQATEEIAPNYGVKGPAIRKHLRKHPTGKYPPRKNR